MTHRGPGSTLGGTGHWGRPDEEAMVLTRQSWREHGTLATAARACAVAVPLAAAVGAAFAVRALFDGVSFPVRLAWAPVVLLVAAPVVLLLERASGFLLALADLLERSVAFAARPPSRTAMAWLVSSPRESEMVVERLRRHGLPCRRHGRALLASIVGLERHHPEVRARLAPARGCIRLLADELALPPGERRLADWLVTLRLTADVVAPPDLDAWLAAAVRAVPGASPAPTRSTLIGALAGFAVEFGVLAAAPPHGAGMAGVVARRMLADAAEARVAPEAVAAFRNVSDDALRRLAPERVTPPATPLAWRRVALGPALALGAAALVTVVAVAGVGPGGHDGGEADVAGVLEGNRAPRARADSVDVPAGGSVVIDVVANDTDPDGDTLVVDRFDPARLGTVERFDGDLRYTAPASSDGTDRFAYTVVDGHGGRDEAVVTLTVTP